MDTRTYNINLRNDYFNPVAVGLSQYDEGVVLAFNVYDGTDPAEFAAGTTAQIMGVRPSGVGFDVACTLTDNVATVSTITDMTGEAGIFPVEIRFYNSGVNVGTCNFIFVIEKAAHPNGTIDADITHEQDIVDKINQILIQTTPDTTLSEAGVAADSKAVGDNIRRIDGQIGTLGTRITNTEDDISYQSLRIDRTNKVKAPVIWEEASGNPAVFDDGANMYVKDLTLTLTPSQDLNGYDYAWAGGNGKNKLNIPSRTITVNGVTATVVGGVVTLSGTCTDSGWIQLATGLSLEGEFTLKDFANQNINTTGNRMQVYSTTTENNIPIAWNAETDAYKSGTLASANDYFVRIRIGNGINYSGVVLKPMLVVGSTAPTEFEPYENICPISGAESVTVKRTGKNLLANTPRDIGVYSGITVTEGNDGRIHLNGTATGNNNVRFGSVTLPAGDYVFSGMTSAGSSNTYFLNITPTASGSSNQNLYSGYYEMHTTQELLFTVRVYFRGGQTLNDVIFEPMIRPASISDDTYEPYSGIDTNVDFGQTIYGGTVNPILWDLQGGDIVFDRKVFSVGELTWSKQSGNIFRATPDNVTGSASYDLSDTFRRNPVADSAMQNGDFKLTVAGSLYVKMEGFGTAAGFKAAYADAKFCAKLAHSEIGAMPPTDRREITTAYLDNVITAQPDKGNVTNIKVTYPADTKAYIDKAIAAISG